MWGILVSKFRTAETERRTPTGAGQVSTQQRPSKEGESTHPSPHQSIACDVSGMLDNPHREDCFSVNPVVYDHILSHRRFKTCSIPSMPLLRCRQCCRPHERHCPNFIETSSTRKSSRNTSRSNMMHYSAIATFACCRQSPRSSFSTG